MYKGDSADRLMLLQIWHILVAVTLQPVYGSLHVACCLPKQISGYCRLETFPQTGPFFRALFVFLSNTVQLSNARNQILISKQKPWYQDNRVQLFSPDKTFLTKSTDRFVAAQSIYQANRNNKHGISVIFLESPFICLSRK